MTFDSWKRGQVINASQIIAQSEIQATNENILNFVFTLSAKYPSRKPSVV